MRIVRVAVARIRVSAAAILNQDNSVPVSTRGKMARTRVAASPRADWFSDGQFAVVYG